MAARGVFNDLARPVERLLGSPPGTPVPSAPYSRSLRLKVSIPRIVGITIKVIAVHGKLREMIQDVSGRRGMSQRVELMEYEKN